MKQLLVDSMLCFLCDRPVTVYCPILVMEKMKTMTSITRGLKLYPPDFKRDANNFKVYFLKLISTNKLKHHPLCTITVYAVCINEPCFFFYFKIPLSRQRKLIRLIQRL